MTSNHVRRPGRWRTGPCTVLALIMGACASPPNTASEYDLHSEIAAFKRSVTPPGGSIVRPQSGVSAFEVKDEMQGTATYYIFISAEDYRSYLNENKLRFICHPTGEVSLMLHWGGEYSGGWDGPSIGYMRAGTVHLKFDDEPTLAATYDYFKDKAVMRWFLDKVKAHERLFVNSGSFVSLSGPPYRFTVGMPGLRTSQAAIREFERQCLGGPGDPEFGSETTSR